MSMNDENRTWQVPPEEVTLSENEVHVWRASLTGENSDKSENSRAYSLQHLLSIEERERAGKFYFERDRRNWVVAHGILRILLAQYLDTDPRTLRFETNAYGKPLLAAPHSGANLHFNLSHSGKLALYAFAFGRQVGVDVEYTRSGIDYEELARRYFSRHEYATVQSLPAAQREEAFFLGWSRKEAYIKARGKGVSIPLEQFDVSLTPGEPAKLLGSRENPPAPAQWSLYALAPGTGYVGALAVEGFGWHLSRWQYPG
jgi:4'-phosphopantetheinyl transferase